LDALDWPESVKEMQRNWIGRSEGAEIEFAVDGVRGDDGEPLTFTVFTTRPDTLFGATYCVLAPESPLVTRIAAEAQRAAVDAYVAEASQKSDLLRTDLAKEKTGVFTGAYAVHPVTGDKLQIWIADYVLMSYGTGAIMAVPGHDERDHAFAKRFELPIVEVISGAEAPIDEQAHSGDGVAVNSDFLDGLAVDDAKARMITWLEEYGRGRRRVQYRLRDWLFSRQRYWGEPFPFVHVEGSADQPPSVMALPVDQLPVRLPSIDAYRPTEDGRPPLARAGDDWMMVELPDGRRGVRETNTMPQWAGSCWYYLRFVDPRNEDAPWNEALERYWMPIDLYIGGVEHAVLHLLYARFWHKVLFDCGLVSTREPFQKLFNQGMILAQSYRDASGKYHPRAQLVERDGTLYAPDGETAVTMQVEKMSKSKQNGVDPMQVIDQYGADAVRLYELFMGPLEQTKPWQMESVEGVYRFLARAWRLVVDEETGALNPRVSDAPGADAGTLWRTLHKTIKKVGHDTEVLHFNTAISQMMIFVNEATTAAQLPREILTRFVRLLAPYAPHLAEELWQRLGCDGLACVADWPEHDEALCVEDTITVVVQVNGKLRDRMTVARDTDRAELEQLALATEGAQRFLDGATPRKVIVVPNRLVNVVV
ncbi:MAG: leucine--tRNA ligase, partial [Acidobacteriota bacterium]